MTATVKPLTTNLNTAISCTLSALDLAALSASVNNLENANLVVPSESCLTAASQNTGRIVFNSGLNKFQLSNGISWTDDFSSSYGVCHLELFGWGINGAGQIGNGSAVSTSSPASVVGTAGSGNWCSISASCFTRAGITTDGILWTWGNDICGALGAGTAGSSTYRSSPGTTVGGGTNWLQVEVGLCVGVATKKDGTLWTWGHNNVGQLGIGTSGAGTNRSSPGTVAGGGTNWCQASTYCPTTAAIKTDGTLWTWGYNTNGLLGNSGGANRSSPGTTSGGGTNWCFVSMGCQKAAAIKTDGTLWTWGYNKEGELGDGSITTRNSPVTVAGGGTWCVVNARSHRHAAGIKTDGTLWSWGANSTGQLGINTFGSYTRRSSPVQVWTGGTNWKRVATGYASNYNFSCGGGHTLATKADGTLWHWGSGRCGVSGNNNIYCRCTPCQVTTSSNTWTLVAASNCGSMAVKGFIKGV